MQAPEIDYATNCEALERLLASVDRPGDFCAGGRSFAPMPVLAVDGVGTLSFPVPDAQVEALIAVAGRAPYGKGVETLVDAAVRIAGKSTRVASDSAAALGRTRSRRSWTPWPKTSDVRPGLWRRNPTS